MVGSRNDQSMFRYVSYITGFVKYIIALALFSGKPTLRPLYGKAHLHQLRCGMALMSFLMPQGDEGARWKKEIHNL